MPIAGAFEPGFVALAGDGGIGVAGAVVEVAGRRSPCRLPFASLGAGDGPCGAGPADCGPLFGTAALAPVLPPVAARGCCCCAFATLVAARGIARAIRI